MTQEQVAKAVDWSLSKIIRIETGAVSISTTDLLALLSHYNVTDSDLIEELVALARSARRPSWWNKYREVLPTKMLQFIELEEAASVIRSFEPMVIPGLLQTKEYTEALLRAVAPSMSRNDLDTRVEVRIRRQRLLAESDRFLFFILDESVLLRLTANKEIADGQITRLIDAAVNPNISIEIVPLNRGIYHGFTEPFTILEFADAADSDVLYLERVRDAVISQDETGQIAPYRRTFERLSASSLGPNGSTEYLRGLLPEGS